MSLSFSDWLSIAGISTGAIGMITGISAAVYTRRQAVAAEGPQLPDVEVQTHEWVKECPDWYNVYLIIRNRTGSGWVLKSARLKTPNDGVIISNLKRPTIRGAGGGMKPVPLKNIEPKMLSSTTEVNESMSPPGSADWEGRAGHISHSHLYIRIPKHKKNGSISIVLTFEEKILRAKLKTVLLVRKLAPTG